MAPTLQDSSHSGSVRVVSPVSLAPRQLSGHELCNSCLVDWVALALCGVSGACCLVYCILVLLCLLCFLGQQLNVLRRTASVCVCAWSVDEGDSGGRRRIARLGLMGFYACQDPCREAQGARRSSRASSEGANHHGQGPCCCSAYGPWCRPQGIPSILLSSSPPHLFRGPYSTRVCCCVVRSSLCGSKGRKREW